MKEIKIPTSTLCGAAVAVAGGAAAGIVDKTLKRNRDGKFMDVLGTAVVVAGIHVATIAASFAVSCNEKLDITLKLKDRGGKRLKKNKDEKSVPDEEPDYPAEFL